MEPTVLEQLAELQRRVAALEAEVERLRRADPAHVPPRAPSPPDVPDPLHRPGPPPGSYPSMSAERVDPDPAS